MFLRFNTNGFTNKLDIYKSKIFKLTIFKFIFPS